jgi:uncharacterized repeat protein (TIGR01451 family)
VEIYEKLRTRPMALVLTAVGLALLLVTVLSLSLSARAEPVADDPTVEKWVSTDQAAPGEVLTYTVYIFHEGAEASLWMTDTLPPEVTYVGGSLQVLGPGSASYSNGAITWSDPDFGFGNWVYITFTVEISPDLGSATVVNTAEVTGTGTLVSASASTGVSPGELQVSKEASSSSVRPGEQLGYTVHISHVSGGAVSAVSMTDSLPPEVSYASGLGVSGWADGSCGVLGDVITCTGRMEPAEEATIDFTVDVSAVLSEGTYFTNTAYVSGAGLPLSASVAASARTDFEHFFPVVFINYPPILTLTVSTPAEGVYTTSFMHLSIPAVYLLQEATSSNFQCNLKTYTTTQPYIVFDKGSEAQTWYYRVRAYGSWGESPAWSNVDLASTGYYDDFSCTASGWPDEEVFVYYSQSSGKNKYWRRGYLDGNYRIQIDGGGPWLWFIQPTAFAPYQLPSDKYCVEAKVKYYQWGYWDNYGVIFAANESGTEFYVLGTSYANSQLSWGLLHKWDYEFPKKALFGAVGYAGIDRDPDLVYNDWNEFQISVDGDDVTSLYINGHSKLGDPVTMPGLSDNMVQVGFFAGVYEITPMDWRVKYFRVILDEECTP